LKDHISSCFSHIFHNGGIGISTDPFISTLTMSLEADQNFIFPPNFHVTLSFFGGNASLMSSCPLLQSGEFIEDTRYNSITIRAFIIVANKIMCALVTLDGDDRQIYSSNEFPHITLMRGDWKPVMSNQILKALFNDKYGLKREMYGDLVTSKVQEGYIEKMCVNMQKEGEVECYLVVPKEKITIEAYMKSYYAE
jgi:hypothetical protein